MTERLTNDDADMMALAFLRDNGPHTMGPISTDGAFAAAYIFMELSRRGFASKIDFGNGSLQYAISAKGLRALQAQETSGA